MTAITLLLGVYALSRRGTADLLRDMFSLPISEGTGVPSTTSSPPPVAPTCSDARRPRCSPPDYAIRDCRGRERLHSISVQFQRFPFDTDVLIEILNAKNRIVELPIPIYDGNEICRVNGVKYARDVLISTMENVAHRSGIFYQRRFDPISPEKWHYDLKLEYASRPAPFPRWSAMAFQAAWRSDSTGSGFA